MEDPQTTVTVQDLNGHNVRTVRIDETDFVAMQDFCVYLQQMVGKIVELSHRQRDHISFMSTTLDAVCDVLSEKHPELREELLKGLTEQEQVQIDCEKVTEMDFFAIQMLCSAHRTSVSWNKLLTWHGALPEVAENAIRRTGFARHHGCDLCPDGVCCMWI